MGLCPKNLWYEVSRYFMFRWKQVWVASLLFQSQFTNCQVPAGSGGVSHTVPEKTEPLQNWILGYHFILEGIWWCRQSSKLNFYAITFYLTLN